MSGLSRELKVGIATFVALLLLGGLVFVTGGKWWREKGYEIEILLEDASGLKSGSPVYISGVEGGHVIGVYLIPARASVKISVREEYKIPIDSSFIVDRGGLLGEANLKIYRGQSEEYLSPGSTVNGKSQPGMDELIAEVRKNLQIMEEIFSRIKEIMDDQEVWEAFRKASIDLPRLIADVRVAMQRLSNVTDQGKAFLDGVRADVDVLTERWSSLSGTIEGVVKENSENLRMTVTKLKSSVERIDSIITDFDVDGEGGKDLRRAVKGLGDATQSLTELARNLDAALFEDGEGKLPTLLENVTETASQASELLEKVQSYRISGKTFVHQVTSGEDEELMMDVGLDIGKVNSPWFLRLAGEDLGYDDAFTGAFGYRARWGELWGGYVHGDLGGGALWDMKTIGLPLALSWQWWDEDGGEWYVQGEWRVTDHWGLFYRHYEDDDDTESVGVSYRF